MKKALAICCACVLVVTSGGNVRAQGPAAPLYTVTVSAGSIKAVNYKALSGSTKVSFRGTVLLPEARGEATVERAGGSLTIDAAFENLAPASRYGKEYLTYVLWAISPEGRAVNLGEIILDGKEGRLKVTSQLQTFGLLVTAEPYYAVSQVSDVVVLENVPMKNTKGNIEEMDVKYELLPRGHYMIEMSPADLTAPKTDKKTPFYLLQARNAVKVSQATAADVYAADSYKKAQQLLAQAEEYRSGKRKERNQVTAIAREAVQTAEDARMIAEKNKKDSAVTKALQDAQTSVEKTKGEADAAKSEALAAQTKATAAQSETEIARKAAEAAQGDAAQARQAAAAAEQQRKKTEQEKADLRAQLVKQLNLFFETRDTARGLIVNMSDVLFDTAKSDLRPPMREKLAKIAGILLAHPGLVLEVEGHTDSVGGEDYNQRLSERRAGSVRDYLVQQGILGTLVTARGFGKSRPIDTNETPEGRQRNRRVEIVVSGDLIGRQATAPETPK